MNSVKAYYQMAKPGIIYGNLITAVGGFLLAAQGDVDWVLFFAAMAGISLVIASACVFNNYLDRGIDAKMARTKKRALAAKEIPVQNAMIYAALLGATGALLLLFGTNVLTFGLALFGFLVYVFAYGWTKRHSVHGTIVGSFAGAVPVVVGYTAVSQNFDNAALALFLILIFWQMPHFYAISIYRLEDYKAAGLPVLPLKQGIYATKLQIVLYILLFLFATTLLTMLGYTGFVYLIVMLILGSIWFLKGIKGFTTDDHHGWARGIFRFSLITITVFSVMISVDFLLL